MIETKVLRVENTESSINSVGRTRGCFGWTVTNVQVTHSENTKTYSSAWDQIGGNQTQTVETNIVDYATITLQRDTAMANYMKIVDLEEEYERLANQEETLSATVEKGDPARSCWYYLFWPYSLLFFKMFGQGAKKAAEQASPELEKVQARMQEILRESRALLS